MANFSEKPDNTQEFLISFESPVNEHCITVEKGKHLFNKMNFVHNQDFSSYRSKPINSVSSFDIFSGTAMDHDIPPIEAEIEEDGVYPRAEIRLIVNKSICSTNNGSVAKPSVSSGKSSMKPSISTNRKNNSKKINSNRNYSDDVEIDKENEGVMLRIKNQESFYDGQDKYQSQLPEGPLYQIYENARIRRSKFAKKSTEKMSDNNESDSWIDRTQNSIIYPDVSLPAIDANNQINDILVEDGDNDSIELEPVIDNDPYPDNRNFQLFSENFQRLRWAETEEGKKLIKIQKLGDDVIKWQEAQFEVITSEASYYRSLEILVNKIYKSCLMDCYKEKRNTFSENGTIDRDEIVPPLIKPVLSATQKHHLFSNILEIHIVSGELLKALESRWRENPFINDLSDILFEFCHEKLRPYITYLRNQRYQTDTYNKLLNVPQFVNIIKNFECDPECKMMNLCSFLMLPMQRVLRLKLLMTVVKHHTPKCMSTASCDRTIEALEKLIKECSDEKMVMEQKEEILLICNRLIIKDKMNVSIGSKPLLQKGHLKISSNNDVALKSLGSSFMRRNNNKVQLYLFEDQLIIAKPRKLPLCVSSDDDREIVVDSCPRSEVKFICSPNSTRSLNRYGKLIGGNFNFKLILSKGIKGCAEYCCTAESQEDFNDWQNIFSPKHSLRDGFDFSEAFVIKDYFPSSKKEIELKKGQILNITRIIDDDKAMASSGGRQGVIFLSYVQFISTPQPNPDMINDIRFSDPIRKVSD